MWWSKGNVVGETNSGKKTAVWKEITTIKQQMRSVAYVKVLVTSATRRIIQVKGVSRESIVTIIIVWYELCDENLIHVILITQEVKT